MGEGSAGNVVLTIITEFTSEFRTVIDGNTNDLSLNELSGGARISYVFHELFNNGVKGIDPFDQVKDGDIRTILYNSSVREAVLFNCKSHPNFDAGLYTIVVCWHHRIRGYRQAADQTLRRSQLKMLPTGLRRTYPYSRPATRKDRAFDNIAAH